MTVDLLRRHGRPVEVGAEFAADMKSSAVADLASYIAGHGLSHEQEEISPEIPAW